jgi:hypothetical protein
MKKLLLLSALSLLLVAAPADAKDISPAKAKKFLEKELSKASNELAAQVKQEVPELTLVNSQVNDCKKKKTKKPRTDCDLAFTFRDQQGADVTCEFRVKVVYTKTKPKKLTAKPAGAKVRCAQPQ